MPKRDGSETLAETMMRIYSYGTEDYYEAITKIPSYRSELERTRAAYNPSFWSNPLGIIPKFTTTKFNEQRERFQKKYGQSITVLGLEDLIHIKVNTKISQEEMAAHRWAEKRKLPTPLNGDQLKVLAYKKQRFMKALASPTPTWLKNVGAVMTSMDNLEDALVTISVLGRIAAKAAPKLAGKIVPGAGWLLLGSDILNLCNVMSWVSFSAMGNKRLVEKVGDRNPFHTEMKASRAKKLSRKFIAFGEMLEIAQTTDQTIGLGLCLGGIVGMIEDLAVRAFMYLPMLGDVPIHTTRDQAKLRALLYEKFKTDVRMTKQYLRDMGRMMQAEEYQLEKFADELGQEEAEWLSEIALLYWNQYQTAPDEAAKRLGPYLQSAMLAATNTSALSRDDQHKVYLGLGESSKLMLPWWIYEILREK